MKRLLLAAVAATLFAGLTTSRAQLIPNGYMNIDWQSGAPVNTGFADDFSGWGLNLEGGYFLTDNISVGAFINYQTNFSSVPRQTLDLGGGTAMTTNQKHSIFELPFGVAARYTWMKERVVQPYAGLKLGAEWSQISTYYYVVKHYDEGWGFHLSPEVGITVFPRPEYRFGIHVAAFYSYATNKGSVLGYSVDGINRFGFRVGISF